MLKNFEQIVWNEVFCRMYSKMEQTKTQMKNRNKNAPLKRILSHFAMAHSCHVELIEQIFEVLSLQSHQTYQPVVTKNLTLPILELAIFIFIKFKVKES